VERVLDRATIPTLTGLAGLIVVGWLVTLASLDMMDPSPPMFLGAWTAMMVAMMLPSAAPFVLLYRVGATPSRTAMLTAGYLLVWAALGVLAYAYMRSGVMIPAWIVLGGAGVYQLTPLKTACLRKCRTPADFLIARWGRSPLRLGVEHGAWCAGCCWALMAVLVVVGSMGIGWVALLAALVFLEKLAPRGDAVARAAGVVFIVLALTKGALAWPPGI
jgi:predicted metal-binding membrane protein